MIILASLLLFLTSVSVAHAECAWVLWLGTGTTYTPFGAYGETQARKSVRRPPTR